MTRWGRVAAAVAVAVLMALSGVPPSAFGPGAPGESVESVQAASEWDYTGTSFSICCSDNTPTDIYAASDGHLYISQGDEDSVVEYFQNGSTAANHDVSGQMTGPKGVARAPDGGWWVVDVNDGTVYEYDSSWNHESASDWSISEVSTAQGISLDPNDNKAYIPDSSDNTVKVYHISNKSLINNVSFSYTVKAVEHTPDDRIFTSDETTIREHFTNWTETGDSWDISSEDNGHTGITTEDDNSHYWTVGFQNDNAYKYHADIDVTGTSGGDPPYVDSISPNDGEYLNTTNRSTNLNATVKDPESDPIDAKIFWNPLNGSGWHQVASETDITSGNEISATVDAKPGENWWKVETDDDVNAASNSTRFEFYVGDQVVVYNGSDYTLANSSTLTINATSTVDNWRNDTQITNAKFDWIPGGRHEHRVDISHPWKFKNTTITVEDPAETTFVLLTPNSDNATVSNWANAGKTHLQCFELDDGTGNFPPSDTVLRAKQRYDGEWRLADNDRFGANNNASLWLQDGETYRLSIKSDDGNVRSLNEFEADSSISGCVTLVVESEDEDAVGPEDSGSVEEGTVNGTDVGYAWDAWRVENGTGLPYLKFEWELADSNTSTESFQLQIYEYQNKSNRTIYNNSFGSINSIEHRQDLNSSQENDTWVVQWNATIDGTKVNGSRVLGPQDIGPGLPVDSFWKELAALAGILMVAGLAGGARAEAGAILASLTAGIFFLIGWLPPGVGAGVILAALTVGALYYAATEGEPT